MSEGTFKKVGASVEAMYGPRAILVCGYAPSEQKTVIKLLEAIDLTDVPIIFATETNQKNCLAELLILPDQSGRDSACDMARAIVMSGITEKELHQILSAYKGCGLPRPLWATLTPFSETWTLSSLLEELQKERAAMEERNKLPPTA